MASMNSTINGGNHGNRGDDFPPRLRSSVGKPYPTRAESKKETVTAEKKKGAGRGLIPCPAGGSCGPCGGATRTTRATERKTMKTKTEKERGSMPPHVLIVTITPEQEAAILAEAKAAGVDPALYFWRKIQETPGVLVSP